MKSILSLCMTVLFIALGSSIMQAQNIGKISGKVTDSNTGDPLIGANILIKGTNKGASTDAKGRYFILQIEPGNYTLRISYIGYQTKVIKDVNVKPSLTTTLNIELSPQSIETGEEIVVTAEEKMVQKDVTNTRISRSGKELEVSAGIESTGDIFRLQGGAIQGQAPQKVNLEGNSDLQVRDESLKNIHIRGGRGGEVLYLVDGMPVTHPIYGGRSVLDLNVNDVSQMELITGAFNAEYGQAQSGVVNITTRSGSEHYTGGVQYKNDVYSFMNETFDRHFLNVRLGGPEPITQKWLPELNINLPGKMFFFTSLTADMENGAFSNGRDRKNYSPLGLIDITGKQSNKLNLNAKINYKITPKFEVIGSFNGSWHDWSSYNWLWKNYPNHMASYYRGNQNLSLQIKHTLSSSTFYNVRFGYLGVTYKGNLDGKTPADFWADDKPDSSLIGAPQINPATGFYDNQGFENIWRNDKTKSYTVRGDITSQVNPYHLVKTGFHATYHNLQYVDIQGGGVQLSPYGRYVYEGANEVPAPPGPFKTYGANRWVFHTKPAEGSFFLQDKYELENLIVNAGVRMDWFYLGKNINRDSYKSVWKDATGLDADWSEFKYKFSPRFGISFPISENTVMFFSYGHFNQLPELQFYYRDPYSGGLTGNPHLDYVQTIQYEFGFTHSFNKSWAVDIKSYNKDISNQIGTTQLRANLGLPVSLYDNKAYARARGIETKLKKKYSHNTSLEMTYTLQWATGYSSSAFDDYVRSINDFPNPIRERRLNWDIRHQLLLSANIYSSEAEPLSLFGYGLGKDWNLSILSDFSSGRPYTPGTTDPVEQQKLENTQTGPISLNMDLKFRKTITLGGVNATLIAEMYNIFDNNTINMGYGFNNWTGEPYQFGDLDQPTQQYYTWLKMYQLMDPRRYNPGRRVQLGLEFSF